MIKFKGAEEATRKLRAFQLKTQISVDRQIVRKLKIIFTDVVKSTPQWSGNYASNWQVNIGWKSGGYHEIEEYLRPMVWEKEHMNYPHYYRGRDPAVEDTILREFSVLPTETYMYFWSQPKAKHAFTISNATPYAADVELQKGPIDLKGPNKGEPKPIRKVNLDYYGGVAIKATIEMRYKNLGQ